jgi:hypothetical protein
MALHILLVCVFGLLNDIMEDCTAECWGDGYKDEKEKETGNKWFRTYRNASPIITWRDLRKPLRP